MLQAPLTGCAVFHIVLIKYTHPVCGYISICSSKAAAGGEITLKKTFALLWVVYVYREIIKLAHVKSH